MQSCGVVEVSLFVMLKVHEKKVVGYLLKLLKSTKKAEWVQNSQVAAKKGGGHVCIFN